ncbi:MAG: 50S ribosomal protein L4 [Candidatus Tantalella remota]|nr:50S ribosomal protein L4 [Candidatus Tantalella remota]
MKKEQVDTKVSVYDLAGKVIESVELDTALFDGKVNNALLYEAKKMYEANARRGTASCKTRAEVSGGGAKPWRQKGTGRARVGSSRNPLWRHGGAVFGPKPRDFSYSMPKKALNKALLSGLNARLQEQMIKLIVKIELAEPKTKEFKAVMDNLELGNKTLVVVNEITDNVKKASGNIKKISLKEARNINVRDVLLNECLLIEKDALDGLLERLK